MREIKIKYHSITLKLTKIKQFDNTASAVYWQECGKTRIWHTTDGNTNWYNYLTNQFSISKVQDSFAL